MTLPKMPTKTRLRKAQLSIEQIRYPLQGALNHACGYGIDESHFFKLLELSEKIHGWDNVKFISLGSLSYELEIQLYEGAEIIRRLVGEGKLVFSFSLLDMPYFLIESDIKKIESTYILELPVNNSYDLSAFKPIESSNPNASVEDYCKTNDVLSYDISLLHKRTVNTLLSLMHYYNINALLNDDIFSEISKKHAEHFQFCYDEIISYASKFDSSIPKKSKSKTYAFYNLKVTPAKLIAFGITSGCTDRFITRTFKRTDHMRAVSSEIKAIEIDDKDVIKSIKDTLKANKPAYQAIILFDGDFVTCKDKYSVCYYNYLGNYAITKVDLGFDIKRFSYPHIQREILSYSECYWDGKVGENWEFQESEIQSLNNYYSLLPLETKFENFEELTKLKLSALLKGTRHESTDDGFKLIHKTTNSNMTITVSNNDVTVECEVNGFFFMLKITSSMDKNEQSLVGMWISLHNLALEYARIGGVKHFIPYNLDLVSEKPCDPIDIFNQHVNQSPFIEFKGYSRLKHYKKLTVKEYREG